MRLAYLLPAACVIGSASVGWLATHEYVSTHISRGIARTLQPGRELAVVLVGASWCAASKEKGFDSVIASTFAGLRRQASARQARFAAIGVALDWDVSEGVKFLNSFGDFDEIEVGRDWLNAGYDRYVHTVQGVNGVPQIVVILRDVTRRGSVISLGKDSVLASVVGPQAIRKWLAAGLPLDSGAPRGMSSTSDSQSVSKLRVRGSQ